MFQDLIRFHLPFELPLIGHDIVIHGFGLMMVVGFLCAMWLAKYLARRSGLDGEVFANAALLGLFAGVLGARLSHVLENFSDFTRGDRTVLQNLGAVMDIGSGGLTYYGGFLLGFPTLVIYGLVKKVPIRLGMDIIAPAMMVGLGFGRIGCFLNGCCYGAECDAPWAVEFPYGSYAYEEEFQKGEIIPPASLRGQTESGVPMIYTPRQLKDEAAKSGDDTLLKLAATEKSHPVHPAQLYSSFTAFLLAAVLLAYFTKPHAPGMVFALMMVLEGIARFVLESLRVEPPVVYVRGYGLSLSMVLGVGLAVFGLILAVIFSMQGKDDASASVALA